MNSYRERKKEKAAKNRRVAWYIFLGVLFVLIIAISITVAILRTQKSSETYVNMEEATLPTVRISYGDGEYETQLHGYVNEMNLLNMRDVIVPLNSSRELSVEVLAQGNTITEVSYFVRSLDGKEYLDGGKVTEFKDVTEDSYFADFRFTDLLTPGREYMLILQVPLKDKTVHFYTRLMYAKNSYEKLLLDFAKEFSDSTYDRDKASFIVNYIQPDNKSETNDYSYTDIHSKYTMFTFGQLNVRHEGEVLWRITELEPTQLSVTLEYEIKIQDGDTWRTFAVNEFFCVRVRSNKVYLLDYYRTLEEEFSPAASTSEKGRILLGVGDANSISVMNSDNFIYTVFVKNRELWSYNAKTNSMNLVFSFSSESDKSGRSNYNHHNVEAVKVSDDGSIDFMVYGYMNRGSYEGQVGICFYRYDAKQNATSRLFYMPVNQSEQILMMDLGTLAYVNSQDVCYLRYGDGIYSIDLNSGESVEVTIRAYPGMYAMNTKGNVVAWQEGENLTYPERLVILNMDTQTTLVVNAEEGTYIKILDFIGDDIIYGFGRRSDSVISANIDVNQLLTRIAISSNDEKLTVQEEYTAKNCFILSVGVYPTRVAIRRVKKLANGSLEAIDDDVLLVTQKITDTVDSSLVTSRKNADFKKEYYIQIGRTTNSDSQFSVVSPRFEINKQANVIELQHRQTNVYYVYGYGKMLAVESEINVAIQEAYDVFGTVLDENMNYIWTRGTRDLVKTISIQPHTTDVKQETLAAALRVLCAQEGIQLRDAESQLDAGVTPLEIINGTIGQNSAVNLYGCTLQEALYFINAGHPVLTITGNREAVVLVGYDTNTISVFDPLTGETTKISQKEAQASFEELNRFFITYK